MTQSNVATFSTTCVGCQGQRRGYVPCAAAYPWQRWRMTSRTCICVGRWQINNATPPNQSYTCCL